MCMGGGGVEQGERERLKNGMGEVVLQVKSVGPVLLVVVDGGREWDDGADLPW